MDRKDPLVRGDLLLDADRVGLTAGAGSWECHQIESVVPAEVGE